jgi:retinol dehydrogenase 14
MRALGPFLRSPEKGAETGVYLATAPEVRAVTGELFVDRKQKRLKPVALDDELGRRLWDASARLAGVEA